MSQPIIDEVIVNLKFLLRTGKVKNALVILRKEIAPISEDLEDTLVVLSGSFSRLEDENNKGIISRDDYQRELRILSSRLLSVADTIPDELRTMEIMGKYKPIYTTNNRDDLEKILGPENNLVSMEWVYRCIEVSKSVCQVIRRDGEKGTGWMIEDGWVITNHHVIPNADWARDARIVFNYEDKLIGNKPETSIYELDPEGALFSSLLDLDYALIKVKDNGNVPLSRWGVLEVDSWSEPQKGHPVNIIQHPKGGKKQIALTKNEIINVDGKKIFYKTDTEKGSSGSPVLNNDWKVIGLHHAGRTAEDGGLVVNSQTGERQGANEGILIKDIMKDIQSKR